MSLKAMLEKQKADAAAKMGIQDAKASVDTPVSSNPSERESGSVADNVIAGGVSETKVGARLTFGAKKPSPPVQAVEATHESITDKVDASPVNDGVMSLDDLNDSTDTGLEPRLASQSFDDEIPCTAPERELPPELSDAQKNFVTQLDSIYEIMHDPELFGSMIRTIMQELQEVPDYMKLMADQDVHTMIRGLRSSMGLAKIKKAEKSTKSRAAKKSASPTAMAGTLDEIFSAEDW